MPSINSLIIALLVTLALVISADAASFGRLERRAVQDTSSAVTTTTTPVQVPAVQPVAQAPVAKVYVDDEEEKDEDENEQEEPQE